MTWSGSGGANQGAATTARNVTLANPDGGARTCTGCFTVTGPTCDSSDTLLPSARLPSTLAVGDVVYFGTVGAYTLSYGSSFNGFPPPASLFVGAL